MTFFYFLFLSGYIYVHEWCAVWCPGVRRDENDQLLGVVVAVAAGATRRCYHCSRYGAGPPCIVPSCNKHFHIPCAAAASAFQNVRTLTLICSQHLDHVPNSCELITYFTLKFNEHFNPCIN